MRDEVGIRVKLLYFAWLRAKLGKGSEELVPPPTVTTVGALLDWLDPLGLGLWFSIPVAIAICMALALAVYRFVERPLQKAIRGYWRARSPRPAV